MDPSPSPPDLPDPDPNMALAVAHNLPPMSTIAANGPSASATNKRYRPSPAKTFQCRGYGECRMVFSRSEHLARHIRKHTGERPFTCHCSKQFSRLDNLRQHAQTVHADKQDDNERMMRDLTSLHASMSAANKLGGARTASTTRKPSNLPNGNASTTTNGGNSASASSATPLILIKQEDVAHQRPDTSTGYESGEAMYPANGSSFRDQSHSFREPGQSFLAPPTSTSTGAAPAAHSQSFLAYPRTRLQVSDSPDGPRPSSRPTTASGLADPHPRSLPPLAAVVSASLSSPQTPPSPGAHTPTSQQQHQQLQQQSLLPFPSSLGHYRRSSITHRPETAPASASLFARSSFPDRSRLGSSSGRPDLSLLHSGFAGRSFGFVDHFHQQFNLGDSSDLSNSPGNDPSPFYFNPPVPAANSSPGSVNNNPRKRPFGGPDGPSDDANQLRADNRPNSSAGPFSELNYEYGSESRPQSRRLTVMELCNDDDDSQPRPPSQRRSEQQQQQQQQSSPFLLSTAAPASSPSSHPPTTSSGLVSSTSTLRLFDRSTSPGSTQQPTSVFSRTSYAATGPAGDGSSSGRGAKEGGRGALSSDSSTPTTTTFCNSRPTQAPYSPPAILSTSNSASDAYTYGQRQQQQQQHYAKQQSYHSPKYFPHSPTFSSASNESPSCSPRSPFSDSSSAGASPYSSYAHTSTRTTTTTAQSSSSQPTAAAVYATGQHISSTNAHTSSGISTQSHHLHHHHQQQQHFEQQRDAQVRASVSPHPCFGMRV